MIDKCEADVMLHTSLKFCSCPSCVGWSRGFAPKLLHGECTLEWFAALSPSLANTIFDYRRQRDGDNPQS